ncbi:peptidoglycan DD-metalloendopeptidase family protein [Thioalkalivibrio thiocyanodenitrificans]|uniref:peptidoglycan DD-metalloendopeptidase family protein n=1 Tax=Thioalkalivibrio thiocyanodenitrificans TaxID=243063 RepID=UPI000380F892|nr:peptidoglycan DD-metalloendopeptidase family protein [Thioalkalivibrio thiocyanodenitrificans]
MRTLLLCLAFLWPALLHALPAALPAPGGVAILSLGPAGAQPRAGFNDERVAVVPTDGGWKAVVGLPLSLQPGDHRVEVTWADGRRSWHGFTVHDREYGESRITIDEERLVSPGPEDLKRIEAERARIRKALATWTDTVPDFNFAVPAEGRFSSGFGLRRFINDQPRNPHSGLDIAAPTGTPVHAPSPGRVILTGDFFFAGKAVFLDHGYGVISFYAHMNDIHVEEGQVVERGERIGDIGATGRVTGPHLHWTIYLNRTAVEPELFFER